LMLDQILSTISDVYVILDSDNRITNVNKHALRILGINEGIVKNKRIDEILPDLDLKNILHSSEYTSYDEVRMRDKVYGVFITAMNKES